MERKRQGLQTNPSLSLRGSTTGGRAVVDIEVELSVMRGDGQVAKEGAGRVEEMGLGNTDRGSNGTREENGMRTEKGDAKVKVGDREGGEMV